MGRLVDPWRVKPRTLASRKLQARTCSEFSDPSLFFTPPYSSPFLKQAPHPAHPLPPHVPFIHVFCSIIPATLSSQQPQLELHSDSPPISLSMALRTSGGVMPIPIPGHFRLANPLPCTKHLFMSLFGLNLVGNPRTDRSCRAPLLAEAII